MTNQLNKAGENNISWHKQKAPGYKLAVLQRLSSAFLSPRTREFGIRRGWIAILLELLGNPGQSQDAISRSLRIDRAATARALFEMEEQGYVIRREPASDRRQKLVYTTEKTLELAERLNCVLQRHNQALFKGFDPARQRLALEILDDLIANLESAQPELPAHTTSSK